MSGFRLPDFAQRLDLNSLFNYSLKLPENTVLKVFAPLPRDLKESLPYAHSFTSTTSGGDNRHYLVVVKHTPDSIVVDNQAVSRSRNDNCPPSSG